MFFRKILVSIKFVSAILGPETAAPILWAPRISAFFLQGNLHVHKIPRFRGGGYLGFGGGGRGRKCRFCFYGRGDFSELLPCSIKNAVAHVSHPIALYPQNLPYRMVRSASSKPTTEFAQPRLSRVKARSSPARGYKFGCVCSYMAGHYPGILMTGHIGTNTRPNLYPLAGDDRAIELKPFVFKGKVLGEKF